MKLPTLNEFLLGIGILTGIVVIVATVYYILIWAIVTVFGLFNITLTIWQALAVLIIISIISGKPLISYKKG